VKRFRPIPHLLEQSPPPLRHHSRRIGSQSGILRVFASRYGGMRYETMRDMVINTMADTNHRLSGMLRILERIDKWDRSVA